MPNQSASDPSHFYALPVGTNLFELRVEQVLGHGGFGIIYLATDTNLDERVAIKRMYARRDRGSNFRFHGKGQGKIR